MGLLELFLIAVGLSMDAFAVSVCKGLKMPKLNLGQGLVIALFFGGFQAAMPLIGWMLGKQFEAYIASLDHWIAFVLLSAIGIKMIVETSHDDDGVTENNKNAFDLKELLILSIATSIDALAVGITFAFLQVSIVPAVSFIGITTFILAFIGVLIGKAFGAKFRNKAEIAGGIILIFIGLKILLEHLGIL